MDIDQLITEAQHQCASDVHLAAEQPPAYRVDGQIRWLNMPHVSAARLNDWVTTHLPSAFRDAFACGKDLDFSRKINPKLRIRINVSYVVAGLRVTIRLIPTTIPALATLNVPSAILPLLTSKNGLILITGPTGSGKSTTLAAMIEWLNQAHALHILTLEDPIEFEFVSAQALVTQRHVSTEQGGFQAALRTALRQDPDLIMLGEMRDRETISLALTAAETGHLVIATLHAARAPQAIDRLVDVFPLSGRESVRSLLASTLRAVLAQQLIASPQGARQAIYECMIATPAVCNLIREGRTNQLNSVLQTGMHQGMQTMEQALARVDEKY